MVTTTMTVTKETHRHLHCVVRQVKNVWQADEDPTKGAKGQSSRAPNPSEAILLDLGHVNLIGTLMWRGQLVGGGGRCP